MIRFDKEIVRDDIIQELIDFYPQDMSISFDNFGEFNTLLEEYNIQKPEVIEIYLRKDRYILLAGETSILLNKEEREYIKSLFEEHYNLNCMRADFERYFYCDNLLNLI